MDKGVAIKPTIERSKDRDLLPAFIIITTITITIATTAV